jgi:hypothetical protein
VFFRAKILALLVAGLLLGGAISASGAQAASFHTESGENTTVTGEFEAKGVEGSFGFVTNNGVAPCVGSSLHGVMPIKTESTLTLMATLGECFFGTTMGGCDLVLQASGGFAIGGANCATEPIEIHRGCNIKIGPQQGLAGVTYENVNKGKETERDVKATFNVTGIHYTNVSGFPCSGGLGTFVNGKIIGVATLRADDAEGKQKGFWVE